MKVYKKIIILLILTFQLLISEFKENILNNKKKDEVKLGILNKKCNYFLNDSKIENDTIFHSFTAIYKTTIKNQKVIFINEIYSNLLVEVFIDKIKIYPTYKYIFPFPGEHYVVAKLNSSKFKNTELLFYNVNDLISIHFSKDFFNQDLASLHGFFKNCINLKYVNFKDNYFPKVVDCSSFFENCFSLSSFNLSSIVTNNTFNISYMFSNCSSLKSVELSYFNTSNVKDMSGLFYNCSSLTTIDLTNFQTNNVITMKKMFAECSSLRNINLKNFETHNLKDMSYMFKNCKRLNYIYFNITINSKNNIYKKGLFYGCKSLRKKKYDFCIIGYWFGTNYGSLATYYALHQAVKNMGYSILMIDSPIAPLRKSNYDKCHPIKIGRDLYNISEQKTLNRLYEFNEICKGFLLGSDQLWKPFLSRPFKQFFFLDFAYNNKKKIAYGTSFGAPYDGSEEERKITKENLKKFNRISVRDRLSLNITKKIFGLINVSQVCDPSFICNYSEYENLINKSKLIQKEEFFLSYILDPSKEKGHRLERLSIDKNITVIIILDEDQNRWKRNKDQLHLRGLGKVLVKEMVDLYDFMWYFSHTKAIFTDSFHGTIFSIIFKKPFVTLRNIARGGERFFSLLEPINLRYRLFENASCINDRYDLYDKIDYKLPYQKLDIIIKKSYNWLKNALEAKLN